MAECLRARLPPNCRSVLHRSVSGRHSGMQLLEFEGPTLGGYLLVCTPTYQTTKARLPHTQNTPPGLHFVSPMVQCGCRSSQPAHGL